MVAGIANADEVVGTGRFDDDAGLLYGAVLGLSASGAGVWPPNSAAMVTGLYCG